MSRLSVAINPEAAVAVADTTVSGISFYTVNDVIQSTKPTYLAFITFFVSVLFVPSYSNTIPGASAALTNVKFAIIVKIIAIEQINETNFLVLFITKPPSNLSINL